MREEMISRCVLLAILFVQAGAGLSCLAAESNVVSSWPIYHGDAGLRGIAETVVPEKLVVAWRYTVGAPVLASPVVSGGRIFFTAEDGAAYALNMQGEKIWSAAITNEAPTASNATVQVERFSTPPVCIRDTVLIGSDAGFLHALESATGKTRWKYQSGENLNGSPNWIEPESARGYSAVVISQSDAVVHRVDIETGRKVWASQAISRCDGSPAVGKGFVVFGSCDQALHVLSAATGEIIARIELEADGQVAGGVAIDGDLAFAGTRGGLAVCADIRKASIVWTNQVSRAELFATPALASDRVVTCSNDGIVYCLNRANGRKIWSFAAKGTPASPVIAGDKVIVSSGGTMYIFRLGDGSKLWADKAGDSITSPAVIDGKIIIGTDEGLVIMYGAAK